METKEIERIVASAELRNPKVFNAGRERYVAEISFKAGIKEVVEWVSQNIHLVIFPNNKFFDEWQAKLKEWGISQLTKRRE